MGVFCPVPGRSLRPDEANLARLRDDRQADFWCPQGCPRTFFVLPRIGPKAHNVVHRSCTGQTVSVRPVDPELRAIRPIVGDPYVLVDSADVAPQCADWTGRFIAPERPVVRPGSIEEVAQLVEVARQHQIPIVPPGGYTGLVGGAVPLDGGMVVDLRRLNTITDIDAASGQLTAGAGATIAAIQAAAESIGWAYGVDWAARDSATIGGSVATDAGGLRFIRHGSTRRQVLGLEAVLGNGSVVSHLPRVERDNTGYRLASVLCGSEGTLGVVTSVRLRLVPRSPNLVTALVAFDSVSAAVQAASMLRRQVQDLEAVELMLAAGIELVCRVGGLVSPVAESPAALLIEGVQIADATDSLCGVVDSAVATERAGRLRLWRLREEHTTAIATVGVPHKLDVTLPISELAQFVEDVPKLVAAVDPAAVVWCFGHCGDGNVHVNVTGVAPDDDRVDEAVLVEVAARGGSISAEHGIGRAKRRWLGLAHGPDDLAAMRALKNAFDPDGILNPGVLL